MPASVQARVALNLSQWALLVALAVAVHGMGAFYRSVQVRAGAAVALSAVLAVAISHRRDLRAAGRAPVMAVVAALLAFGAWPVARGALGGDHGAGLSVLALCVALSVAFVLGHLASAAQRVALQRAVAVLGVACALSGWVGYAWRIESLALPGTSLWRAAGTLTYENALACLAVAAAMVIIGGLVERETRTGSAALCVLLVTGAATQSRGGAVALLAGITVLLATVGWRALLRVMLRPVLGALVATAALLPSAAVTARARPDLAVLGLAAGLLIALAPRGTRWLRALAAAAAVVLLVGVGGAALFTDQTDLSVLSGRLSLSSQHRIDQHAAALQMVAAQPLTGTGPGNGELRWTTAEGETLVGRFVHNEYLQVAVELGLVGAVLLMAVLGTMARALWHGRARQPRRGPHEVTTRATPGARATPAPPATPGGARWAGAVAAVAAIAVHGALDFVWHLPAIPMVAALLAGTATAPAGTRRGPHAGVTGGPGVPTALTAHGGPGVLADASTDADRAAVPAGLDAPGSDPVS